MNPTPEAVAIVGMACRFPGAPNLTAFWDLLQQGRDAVGPMPPARRLEGADPELECGWLDRIDAFDAAFFGVTDLEADAMDPQQRLLMALSWECFEDAGLLPGSLAGHSAGVFIGLSSTDYYLSQLRDESQVDMYTIAGAAASVSANRISYHFDLRGPSLVVDTACSSSLSAVHLACESLARGECELALAGGANLLLSPLIHQGFAAAMALAPNRRCRPFADDADGIVRGEGAGLVLLKPLSQALADGDRIYALIRGSAQGQDGLTNGLSAPSPGGQREVLNRAFKRAGLAPHQLSFIEAHGTGTPLGDPIEARALSQVLAQDKSGKPVQAVRLGSVKSNFGHLEAASGIAGLIKSALALHQGWLPPSLYADRPSQRIPFESWGLQLQQTGDALAPESVAGVSAFGFGGTNVHVVLQAYPQAGDESLPAGDPLIFPLSARTGSSLSRYREDLAAWLGRDAQIDIKQLATTLSRHREPLAQRQAFVATNTQGLIQALRAADEPEAMPRPRPKLAFLFSGMGSQESGMGRQLLGLEPFRARLADIDKVLLPWLEISLFDLITREKLPKEPELVQPLIFALQMAMVAQWQAWGICPDAVLGSSMGEITAATVAGMLDLETAARLICQRIRLLKTRDGTGHMAVVGLPADQLSERLESEQVWVAAINGPNLCVVAGESEAMVRLQQTWEREGVFVRAIRGATAPSHTPLMAPLGGRLLETLGQLETADGHLPFWSTVHAHPLKGQALDAGYWWQNLRSPVQLYPTLQAMLAESDWTLIEISPHPVLAGGLGLDEQAAHRLEALPSLRRDCSDATPMLESLARLYALGHLPEWQQLYPEAMPPLSIPPYAWEPDSHWLAAPTGQTASLTRPVFRLQPGSKGAQAGTSSTAMSREALLALEPAQRRASLAAQLQSIVASALKLEPAALPTSEPLRHLGIGSLVGMELYQRLKKQLGVSLALSDVLKGPSLDELSDLILKQMPDAEAASTQGPERPGHPPLSFTQLRFWFYDQLAPGELTYHIPVALDLEGPLDAKRLQAACQALVARHEILRTIYPSDEHGQPWQQVLPSEQAQLQFTHLPWQADVEALVAASQAPFSLETLPPFRLTLFSDGAERHRLLIDLHHLVADGYSFKLLFAELASLYAGESLALEVPQYVDFALWQRARAESGAFGPDLDYWRQELADAPELLPLPTDRPRPARPGMAGRRERFSLPPALIAELEASARAQGVTLYTYLLGAWLILLQRLSGSDDLVIGTPVLGRAEAQWAEGIGPYLNMLPLRMQLDGHASLAELMLALQARVLEGFDHQNLPFEQIVEAINPSRELAWHPIYQHVFALHAPLEAEALGECRVGLMDPDIGIARFELALTMHPETSGPEMGSLSASLEYRSELFDPETIAGLISAYTCLLSQIPAGLAAASDQLVLAQGPLQPVLVGPVPSTPPWRLATRIRELVADRPMAIALQSTSQALSYRELLSHAEALAAWLMGQDSRLLALALPRSAELAIAWLGALLAGIPYLPLDPAQPPARLRELLAHAEADTFIAAQAQFDALDALPEQAEQAYKPSRLSAEALISLPIPVSLPALESATDPESYQIFTSGSSGQPKRVRIGEASLRNLIDWHLERYQLKAGEKVSLLANPAFDAAAWEFWPALAAGATICLPEPSLLADPEALKAWLGSEAIQVAFVPTPLLERLFASHPAGHEAVWSELPALRALLTGGDRLTVRPPANLSFKLHNHYGPTENTVVTSCCEVLAGSTAALPPIGEPLPGMALYFCDRLGKPLPEGLAGELWIGGAGLALGYAGPDERQAFVETPLGRLYRSGDRVSCRQGQLQFVGRSDAQLKVRGVRIEPGEIEAALLSHPQLREAVVALHQGRLLAWVAPEGPDDPSGLRSWLSERLPEVMLPARILMLPALPLTERGKIDRRALTLAADLDLQATEASDSDSEGMDAVLAEIWRELLPGVSLDPEADFFALGGHSLLALDLRHQILLQLGLDLPLSELFRLRKLGALAKWLAHEAAIAPWPALVPAPEAAHEPFPLTDIQQAYWVGRGSGLDLGQVSAHAYLELEWPDLDPARLEAALRRLIALHPMLRAIVRPDGSQQVLADLPPYELAIEDLRELDAEAREAQLLRLRNSLSHEVRSADRWPLFGLQLSRLPQGWRLHLSFDALMADATSLLLLARQLEALYAGGTDPEVPEISFRDLVLYERELRHGAHYARDKAYWLDRIDSLPPAPALPLARRPQREGQPRFRRLSGRLEAPEWASLRAASASLGVSPNALLLSLFGSVLARWQEQAPLSLNLTTFARLPVHERIHDIVGDFTRLSLLAFEPKPGNFAAQTLALQQRLLTDLDHGLYSGVELMRELRARRGPDAARMPVVFTSMLGADAAGVLPLNATPVYSQTQTPQVWLDHQLAERDGALVYDWDFPRGLFPEGLIEAIFKQYGEWLTWLAQSSDPQHWQTALPLPDTRLPELAQAEPVLLHAGFVAQAYATPEAIAVLSPKGSLSYGQLLTRAWGLSTQLGQLGSDTPVALWLEPGCEQAVAVLAVLLAGGTYLPFNPAWPDARIASLLDRSRPVAVIASPERRESLRGLTQLPVLAPEPDDVAPAPDILPERSLIEARLAQCDPASLAYIIFTSGSTGEPKGVMIEHAAAWNTVADINRRLNLTASDRVLALSELSFDLSVYDLFGPLAVGAALVYPDPALARDPAHWHRLCQDHGVTIWNSVPALMGMQAAWAGADEARRLDHLRWVMMSGDWIPLELPAQIKRFSPARQLSLGGATEASIWSIAWEIETVEPDWSSIPYGFPLAGQDIRVLGPDLEALPLYASGDLYIAGCGLARGYFGDEAQTAARFLTHREQKLYRTGDRGRLRPDGSIEFLGRQDLQVKIQGYRIELAEIEGALQAHPDVNAAVVLALGPARGPRYLAACVSSESSLDETGLKSWLSERLPAYMLPVRWLLLPTLPLTATGKVDRQAAAALAEARSETASVKKASAELGQALKHLLETELNLTDLDPSQDLMALGINSIDLVRLGNALEVRYGRTPGMGELFSLRSVDALALWYEDQAIVKSAKPQTPSTSQAGISAQTGKALISLPIRAPELQSAFGQWTSTRQFAADAVSFEALASLLSSLASEQTKRLYASAGGVYALSLYLQVRADGVQGLAGGSYRYNAETHALEPMLMGDHWSESLHLPVAREMASASRFSLYLVADLAAMQAHYGPDARDYCLIEAGSMAQLLRQQAAASGIGLCAIAQVNQAELAPILGLSANQPVLLSLIGGLAALESQSQANTGLSQSTRASEIDSSQTAHEAEGSDYEEWLI